jgi:hypothetical protein
MPRRRLLALALSVAWLTGTAQAAGPRQSPRLAIVTPRYLTAGGAADVLAAQVRDGDGQPVADGTAVAFAASLGIVVTPPVATTRDGWAVASMAPATESGFAQIDAVANGGRAEVILWVRPAPAAVLAELAATPKQLTAGGRSVVTARVMDAFGNPAEGDVVHWEAAGGTLAAAQARVDHGRLRAEFTAGPAPGPAWVQVTAGTAGDRVALDVVDAGPSRPPLPVWLPLVMGDLRRPGTCGDVLVNGSFELDADGDGVPEPWLPVPGAGTVARDDADPVAGTHALRLVGDTASPPPALRQAVTVEPGARDGQLWLWARGAAAGGGLRVSVWTTVLVGATPTRAPVLIQRVVLPEPDWLLLAFRLPAPPSGATSIELSPWSDGAAAPVVALDDVQLNVCW